MEKFIEFSGKRITVLLSNGSWWVAVKPICEALNVNYERQRQNIQEDEILSQLPAEQQVVAADGKIRKMLCLPEKYIYGWLFSIRSDSPELIEYKQKCYDILYDHFHGAMTARFSKLKEQDGLEAQIEALEQKMLESEEYQKILKLRKQKTEAGKELKRMDVQLKSGQLVLFN